MKTSESKPDSKPAVLVIDDDDGIQRALAAALAPAYAIHAASSGEEGLTEYERVQPEVVLLDMMLPQMGGMAVLRALKASNADVPVIVMTAYAEVHNAVEAIKLGAADYVQKPIDPDAILANISHFAARAALPPAAASSVIGGSDAMKRAWRLIERFGPTDVPILLQGETGTGKGLVAETIHRLSKRSRAPFVAIDCTTIPGDLAESELFGYEDGAFTGAGRKKRGRVAFADHGTLFLDEIGTLALGTQAKLLTFIEQQAFLPLGARSFQPMRVDVRFVSATNVSLQNAVEEGAFRADLFHRLNGITIELPPLRQRGADIDLLSAHFVSGFARAHGKGNLGIGNAALELLRRYSWPGNVRELQRVLAAAVVLANDEITPDDLPECVRQGGRVPRLDPEPVPGRPGELAPVAAIQASINLREIKEWAGREAQKRVIMELQSRTNITRQELARILGVDPKTLRSRLKEISAVPRFPGDVEGI